MLQHLMVFLTFVRTAHYWTKIHPELGLEDDVKQLFVAHQALAECVLNDPEASTCDGQSSRCTRSKKGRGVNRWSCSSRNSVSQTSTERRSANRFQLRDLGGPSARAAREGESGQGRVFGHAYELRSPMSAMLNWIH